MGFLSGQITGLDDLAPDDARRELPWFQPETSSAPTPRQAAVPLLDLAFDPVKPGFYGELVRAGEVLPRKP